MFLENESACIASAEASSCQSQAPCSGLTSLDEMGTPRMFPRSHERQCAPVAWDAPSCTPSAATARGRAPSARAQTTPPACTEPAVGPVHSDYSCGAANKT
eukprot:CAMPEP_0185850668 /NCGR_PEP_ID=MMETSP1354-20130828/4721_1 /TAXON_ID=708628 /ORGANISM="Erythrolobus madagascarensis, Strain CCMP3276" /LENGTH=100 /DNA_ID=CAMNT_0028551373 /DNA_START=350 /DNA_END=652 /DNA_ORIENTATION=-